MRALLVDDEELARQRLRELLRAHHPEVEVVGEAESAAAAAAAIRELEPEAVFLDVEMSGGTGFQLLEDLPQPLKPAVVFVTAHAAHALEAFAVDAVDYLLKPFDAERLAQAVERVARELEERRAAQVGRELARWIGAGPARARRLALRAVGRVAFVDQDEIEWIDADGNGAKVHTKAGTYEVNESLGALEAKLAGERFLRSHRSTLVNLERVREREIGPHGDYVLVMASGRRLSVGRSHREQVRKALEGA